MSTEVARDRLPRLWFDVSDLVHHHGAWTGIQRVVGGLARAWMGHQGSPALRFCRFQSGGGFLEMPREEVEALIGRLGGFVEKRPKGWRDKLAHRLAKRRAGVLEHPFAPGDLLVNTGLYTYKEHQRNAIEPFLAAAEVHYVGFVHDVMHMRFPEWWNKGEQRRVRGWYEFLGRRGALLLCASEATRRDAEAFYRGAGIDAPDLVPIGLGGDFSTSIEAQALTGEAGRGESALEPGGDFVLFVSTIETRKNHRLLFQCWRRLLRDLGPERVPRLVFVGRRGHLADDFIAELENCDFLDGKIVWRQRVTDAGLAWLYRHCLFTLYPSLYEGWGLPVAESLGFGKYCIASSSSSLPEVGGTFADYFDPFDLPGAYALVRRALLEPGLVAAKEAAIQADYRPISWRQCVVAATGAVESRFGVSSG